MVCLEILSYFVSSFYMAPFSNYLFTYCSYVWMTERDLYKEKRVSDRYKRKSCQKYGKTWMVAGYAADLLVPLWYGVHRKDFLIIVDYGTIF